VNLELITYLILGALSIASAIVTITNRHPLYSAMALIVHFFTLAGLYLTLQSQFIAVLQILVYAGAIMVLVIFVLMLLNLSEEDKIKMKMQSIHSFGILLASLFVIMLLSFITTTYTASPKIADTSQMFSPQALGQVLYTNHLVAFELVGILLLVAIIGAIIMAKKKLVD
jgi:NADH-quinone oxidoreductase subunit J